MYFEIKLQHMERIMSAKIKFLSLIFTFTLFFSCAYTAISVVEVPSTPSPDNAKIEIIYPQNLEMRKSSPVRMEVRVSNYAIGEDSNFHRAEEIKNWSIGQCIRVIIDNKPFFAKITQQIDPFNDEGIYFQKSYEFNLPRDIKRGEHIIRAYLVRSYGESLKGEYAFDVSTFYYKNKKSLKDVNLHRPYLTYNEPSANHNYDDDKPVLLDFYINNCELSHDGYKVKLTIDKNVVRYLDKWSPYYIYGLKKGKHHIELQLIDSKNRVVNGLFNTEEAVIIVK